MHSRVVPCLIRDLKVVSLSPGQTFVLCPADNSSKQGRDGNDAGFLSLTKFHWSVPSCFDKLEFVARWCSQKL